MIETVKRETAERLKEKRWMGETYFCWFQIGCEPGNEQWELRRWIPAYHLWITLPAPCLPELQTEVNFDYLRAYFLHIHRDSIQLLQWTAEFYWSKFSSWLDSTHRSCEELARVWLWKQGKDPL